jgi:hypothetical protein
VYAKHAGKSLFHFNEVKFEFFTLIKSFAPRRPLLIEKLCVANIELPNFFLFKIICCFLLAMNTQQVEEEGGRDKLFLLPPPPPAQFENALGEEKRVSTMCCLL